MDNLFTFLAGVFVGMSIMKLVSPKVVAKSIPPQAVQRKFEIDFIDKRQALKALNGISTVIIMPIKQTMQQFCPDVQFECGEIGTINYHSVGDKSFKTSIVGYKLKRIQDLTQQEIIKNGFKEEWENECYEDGSPSRTWNTISPEEAFRDVWDEHFPELKVCDNPYVWVVEFEVVE